MNPKPIITKIVYIYSNIRLRCFSRNQLKRTPYAGIEKTLVRISSSSINYYYINYRKKLNRQYIDRLILNKIYFYLFNILIMCVTRKFSILLT